MSFDIVPTTRFSEVPLALIDQIGDAIMDGVCREVEADLFPRFNSLHLRPQLHSTFDTFNEALHRAHIGDLHGAETLRWVYFIDLREEDNPYVARVTFCVTEELDRYGFEQHILDCIITYSPCDTLVADGRSYSGLSGRLVKVRLGSPLPYYW